MAMTAIQTLLSLSTWVLTILGIIIAILALWGVGAIYRASCRAAKQIANVRFNAYIQTDEFKEMVKERIAKSVDERWGNSFVVTRLAEELKPADDPSPFPSPGDAK